MIDQMIKGRHYVMAEDCDGHLYIDGEWDGYITAELAAAAAVAKCERIGGRERLIVVQFEGATVVRQVVAVDFT